MLEAHAVLRNDPFSYSAYGLTWNNHEVGFEILLALCYRSLKVPGLILCKFLFTLATISFLARAIEATHAPLIIQQIVLFVTALTIAPQIQFRPQLVTFAMTAAMMMLFAQTVYEGKDRLWLMIPIMALWANFHGGYLVGIALFAVFCLTLVFGAREGVSRLRKKLPLLLLVSAFATMLNPHGWKAWIFILKVITNPLTPNVVIEWYRMPNALVSAWENHDYGALVYFTYALCLFVLFIILIVLTWPPDDTPIIAVAAITILGALDAVRNIALAAIAVSIPLARRISITLVKFRIPERFALCHRRQAAIVGNNRFARQVFCWMDSQVEKCHCHLIFSARQLSRARSLLRRLPSGAVYLGFGMALLIETGFFSNSLKACGGPYPSRAVEFMKQHHLHGNILTRFDWGDYLIWHLGASSKVFIDGRYDAVYPKRVILDYLAFHSGTPQGRQMLGRYPHDFAIVPINTPSYRLLNRQPGWKILYRDTQVALFARGVIFPAATQACERKVGCENGYSFP